jgi:hypothetical protein
MNSIESYQDRITETRILSDAELINDGAHINLGKLVIAYYHYEKARLVHDPLFDVASLLSNEDWSEESDVRWEVVNTHPELDKNAVSAWEQTFPEQDLTVAHALRRNNITSIRDLLVIGREKTTTIRGFGPKTIGRLALMMETETAFGWKDEPTVQDIADFCDSIDQISALAIMPKIEWQPERLSMSQVLTFHPDALAHALGSNSYSLSLYLQQQVVKETRSAAEVFALQFDEAKQGLWTDPTQFK